MWSGVAAVGYHAEGDSKANDSNGGCSCCEGGQTDGRYLSVVKNSTSLVSSGYILGSSLQVSPVDNLRISVFVL